MSVTGLTTSQRTTADGVHVLALTGEIDHTTAGAFHQALRAGDGSVGRTVVDFRDVTFMDSSGINVLVAANNAARAGGGWLRLAHLPRPVLQLLHITGLDDVIQLYPTLAQALAPQSET